MTTPTAAEPYPENITYTRSVLAALQVELGDIQYASELRCRQEIDVLGRLDQALGDVQDIFDEYPDSNVLDAGQVEFLHEAFTTIAALALSQLARLRVHPQLRKAEDIIDDE